MKILYYSPHPHLNLSAGTGYATHMREMITAFEELGHTVHVVIRGGKEMKGTVQPQKENKIKTVLKKIIGKYFWHSLKDIRLLKFDRESEKILAAEVEKFSPDLIYERVGFLFSSGSIIAKKYGIKYFTEVNAPFEEEVRSFEGAGSLFFGKGKRKFKQVLQDSKRVFTVSSALKNFLASTYSVDENKIQVTPNAINLKSIHTDEILKKSIQEKITQGKKVIGFVGSIFPYHGVDLLIRAFSRINKERRDLLLLIVGDGYLIPQLKKLSSDLDCSANVFFAGSIPHSEVFTYIDVMEIAVMARSDWYGSPVKIFEYGAMGKSIIAPDTIPVRDVMENEKDGLLIKPDESEIYFALKKILDEPESSLKMAFHFKKKVGTNHTWNQMAEKVLMNY